MHNQRNRVIVTDKDAAQELVAVNQSLKSLIRKNQNVIDYLDKKQENQRRNRSFNSR